MKKKRKDQGIVLLYILGILILLFPIGLNLYYKQKNKATVRSFERQEIMVPSKNDQKKASNLPLDEKEKRITLDTKEQTPIGILMIPKIKEELPIYEDIEGKLDVNLDKGVVLLSKATMLTDVWAKREIRETEKLTLDPKLNTNMVLTGHRGTVNTNQNIFKNLDKMKKGDFFYINNGEDLLTFQIYETETIKPIEGQKIHQEKNFNQATLVTCTPYLINSHRLIFRAGLVDVSPSTDQKIAEIGNGNQLSDLRLINPINFIILLLLFCIVLGYVWQRKRKKKRKEIPYEEKK